VKTALVATIPPVQGGVTAMLATTARFLREQSIRPIFAWYEPWSMTPGLSVPAYRLLRGTVSAETRKLEFADEAHAIGAWFPELEITHYWATRHWRALIAGADLHLAVSGSCLAARAYADTGTPFLAWIATDWEGDRRDRVRAFPWVRRLLDATVVRPRGRRLERRILSSGAILALSEPTRRSLETVAGRPVVRGVMPQPIDLDVFRPDPAAVVPGRIGFIGRFDDPRKNLTLFLDALAQARASRRSGSALTAEIIGGAPANGHLEAVDQRGLQGAVEFVPYLPPGSLAERLKRLDLVAVTSHQEGLGIAALEAMASGCPLVSTRCGGPEEYVRDGESGYLTGFAADEIAMRLGAVADDRELRSRLSLGARATIEARYSWAAVREIFGAALDELEKAKMERKTA